MESLQSQIDNWKINMMEAESDIALLRSRLYDANETMEKVGVYGRGREGSERLEIFFIDFLGSNFHSCWVLLH